MMQPWGKRAYRIDSERWIQILFLQAPELYVRSYVYVTYHMHTSF